MDVDKVAAVVYLFIYTYCYGKQIKKFIKIKRNGCTLRWRLARKPGASCVVRKGDVGSRNSEPARLAGDFSQLQQLMASRKVVRVNYVIAT